MAQITPQRINQSGAAPVFAAASAGGDTLVNDGTSILHIKNTSGSPVTVTVVASGRCDEGFLHDIQVVVPATTGERLLGPFDTKRFGALAAIQYSATTGVTVAAYDTAV